MLGRAPVATSTDEILALTRGKWHEVGAWQLGEIVQGIAEADRGEFVSETEVAAALNKRTGRPRGHLRA